MISIHSAINAEILVQLVNLTTSYKRRHKGMFFLNTV